MPKRIRFTPVLIGLAVALMSAVSGQAAAADGAFVIKVPFRVSAQAKADIAACTGENVAFTAGEFNVVIQQSGDGSHSVFHRNVIDASGTGSATGTTYRATGHLQAVDNLVPSGGESFTFDLTLNVVGTGGGAHFTAHAVEHLTFTPDGTLTSDVEIDTIDCR